MEDRERDAARECDSGKVRASDRPSSSRPSIQFSSSKHAILEVPGGGGGGGHTSANNLDADEPLDGSDVSDSDDDDDTAAIMAEL